MSYEYAKLGNTCRSSMRVLLSNTKFIDMNDPIYRDSVKLSIPLKMDKNRSKETSKETLKGDTKETSKENMKEESRDDSKYRDDNKGKLLLNTNPILNQMP
jgi:hypothetical protein